MFDQIEAWARPASPRSPRHFGSAERVLAASAEELEGVPGVPPKTARRIYQQLHRAGRA
jgi:excinuclease UvrABC nuclease subunit